MTAPSLPDLVPLARALRVLCVDTVEKAGSGHPGLPLGMADVATVLFARHLKFYSAAPTWADRDRFILSAGHGSALLYALSHLTGYEAMPMAELQRFRQMGSRTPGHPERDVAAGIEMTTGPLGQGIASAVGFALAERALHARFGDDLVDHRTFVLASDGDLMEGISHEACALAGLLKLSRLVVLYDDNGISIDGPTSLSFTEDVPARFTAMGWAVRRVDGHDMADIDSALTWAGSQNRPVLLACKTTIGYGAPTKAGSSACHGSPLGAGEVSALRLSLGWNHAPFLIPDEILSAWRLVGKNHEKSFSSWEKRLSGHSADQRTAFLEAQAGVLPAALPRLIRDLKVHFSREKPSVASRKASQLLLDTVAPACPSLIGGSADLTGSNLTLGKGIRPITSEDYSGGYLHYGVREHGMAAVMNGMALHGGLLPFGGTFLQFSDYCRPAIRLAALMKARSIFVMTHDSIGLGEDGPTHQPVEHLAALRAIPNLFVLRPCDAVETAECWEIALSRADGPSLLALSRQNLPTVRGDSDENLSARGGYVLADFSDLDSGLRRNDGKDVVLVATGSEVSIALAARDLLAGAGVPARVVSLPCFELFRAQEAAYRESVLGPAGTLRVGIEAAIRQGWDEVIGSNGLFVGMTGFGESAPAEALYAHFGITAEAVVQKVQAALAAGW